MFRASILNTFKIVDGSWSAWSVSSPCDVTCGTGKRKQVRECTNPAPSGGGKNCEGSSQQNIPCNTGANCPG